MISVIETFVLLSVASLYITHVPFNKVEESFNTQAVHDIVNLFPRNLPFSNHAVKNLRNQSEAIGGQADEIAHRAYLPWDHSQYPGVVPRTFVGALLVSLPLNLIKSYISHGYFATGDHIDHEHDLTSQFILQIASRFALLSFVAISLRSLFRAIKKRYGLEYQVTFFLITISQFHYMFYASRFLPNTFAAILANLVFASWINRQFSKAIIYIALCVVIFRFDTAIFFGWLLMDGVFIRRFLSLPKLLIVGIPAGLFAIVVTFAVDSIFWSRPVWPEFESLYFNVWLNKSHEWGTQPYFWYVYSCIPRMMLTTVVPMILADHKITRDYLIPVLAFIFTYSFLPHKELRFILFVMPLLNLCATSGLVNLRLGMDKFCQYLDRPKTRPSKGEKGVSKPRSTPKAAVKRSDTTSNDGVSRKRKISFVVYALIVFGFLIVPNFLASFVLSRVSTFNYPGGKAALSLGVTKELLDEARVSLDNAENSKLQDVRSNVAVYVNNLAAQTGMSRFVQVDGVYYSKTPRIDSSTFTKGYKLIYLILEPKEIADFLRDNCVPGKGIMRTRPNGAAKWQETNEEINCRIPNQPEMYCSIVDTIRSFSSIRLGGFLKNLRQIRSVKMLFDAFEDGSYIKLRIALHIIRCGEKRRPELKL